MAAGDAERRYVVGLGWQTVAVSASGIVTAADVDSDGAANGEVLTADGGGGASWEVGGGGSLPAWWTVDSTPGSEKLTLNGSLLLLGPEGAPDAANYFDVGTFDGESELIINKDAGLRYWAGGDQVFTIGPTGAVTISPSDTSQALTLVPSTTEYDDVLVVNTVDPATLDGNYYVLRVHDVTNDIDKASIDADGHLQLEGPLAQLAILNEGFHTFTVRPYASGVKFGTWAIDPDYVQIIPVGVAPIDDNIVTSTVSMWYDDTNGAAKLKFRGRTADDTLVGGEIALA